MTDMQGDSSVRREKVASNAVYIFCILVVAIVTLLILNEHSNKQAARKCQCQTKYVNGGGHFIPGE
mgnify:CR=1 FL=1